MVPNTEVNMAEGQYERSVGDAYAKENESVIYVEEEKDSIEIEMQKSARCLWAIDVPTRDDSSDLGSWVIKETHGPCDRDLAFISDLEPGHSFIIHEDRGMMMNIDEAEHVRDTYGTRTGHVRDTYGTRAEHVGDRAPMSGSEANHGWAASLPRPSHPLRTSRSGQFNGSCKLEGWDHESGYQPVNFCHTFPDEFISTV